MDISVFVPGHITGFFNIENNVNPLKNGSCGAGFLVNRGVLTDISSSDTLEIEVNQGDYTVINEVLKILNIENRLKSLRIFSFQLEQDSERQHHLH